MWDQPSYRLLDEVQSSHRIDGLSSVPRRWRPGGKYGAGPLSLEMAVPRAWFGQSCSTHVLSRPRPAGGEPVVHTLSSSSADSNRQPLSGCALQKKPRTLGPPAWTSPVTAATAAHERPRCRPANAGVVNLRSGPRYCPRCTASYAAAARAAALHYPGTQ